MVIINCIVTLGRNFFFFFMFVLDDDLFDFYFCKMAVFVIRHMDHLWEKQFLNKCELAVLVVFLELATVK
jgi:hypothetical protein